MKIKVTSDSTCDLPASLLEKYDIDLVPLIVMKDEEEFLDNVTITLPRVEVSAPPPPEVPPYIRSCFQNMPENTTESSTSTWAPDFPPPARML